jgi:hypothetical protein
MTIAFQFEDRIGAGFRTKKLDCNFRFMLLTDYFTTQ